MAGEPASGLTVVLLAAGAGSRFGSAKQLATLDGVSLVRRSALAALGAGCPLVVVTGAYAPSVARALDGLDLALVYNRDWARGMGGSLACAVRHLLGRELSGTGIIVCLADQVRIGKAELVRMIEAHQLAPGRILAADHGPVRGPPCLFPAAYFAELAGLTGDRGARALLAKYAAEVDPLSMPQAAEDIDTRADLDRLSLQ
jgi:molybdenum cofactor cytidylyltransferase